MIHYASWQNKLTTYILVHKITAEYKEMDTKNADTQSTKIINKHNKINNTKTCNVS